MLMPGSEDDGYIPHPLKKMDQSIKPSHKQSTKPGIAKDLLYSAA